MPTPTQPKAGETVLLCAHMRPVPESVHFFYLPEAMTFQPPGTTQWRDTSWFLCCGTCRSAILLAEDLSVVFDLIGGHDTWVGDQPLTMREKD